MQPSGAGRYCDSCEKSIVDLSTKSDLELLQFFNKKKNNVCGRLLSSQLNRELMLSPQRASWQWLLPLAVGAMLVSPSQANELRPLIVQSSQTDSVPRSTDALPLPALEPTTINGSVIDKVTGKALVGVKVRQKGFANVMALTDSTGRFSVKVEYGNLSEIFTFDLVGYNKIDWKITDGTLVKLDASRITLGGVSTISIVPEPLLIVFLGKKSCQLTTSKFAELPQDWIENIEILKDAKATSIYGGKGANGVVLIKIKKAYAKKVDFSKKD